MQENISLKAMRRLTAAEGYLELDMPDYALEELEAIDEPGPFQPLVHYMRGEALRGQHRWEDAIEPLKLAAQTIPAPHNRPAWLALGECFRAGGRDELAEVVEMFANTPYVEPEAKILPVVQLNITIQGPIDLPDLLDADDADERFDFPADE